MPTVHCSAQFGSVGEQFGKAPRPTPVHSPSMECDEHRGFRGGVKGVDLVHVAGQHRLVAPAVRAPCLSSSFPFPRNAEIVWQLTIPKPKDAVADRFGFPLTSTAQLDVVRAGRLKPWHMNVSTFSSLGRPRRQSCNFKRQGFHYRSAVTINEATAFARPPNGAASYWSGGLRATFADYGDGTATLQSDNGRALRSARICRHPGRFRSRTLKNRSSCRGETKWAISCTMT